MAEQGKRAEIYTHESNNLVYAMNWSVSSSRLRCWRLYMTAIRGF